MNIRMGDSIRVEKHFAPLRRYGTRTLLVRHSGYHKATVTGLYANGRIEVRVNGAFEAINRSVIIGVK